MKNLLRFLKPITIIPVAIVIASPAFLVAQESGDSAPVQQAADQATDQADQATDDDEIAALYEKLAKYLTGTKWTGQFTISDKEMGELTQEEYYILSAEKMEEGDYWKLVARIKYGKNDLTMPLPLEIKWADATPVITVNQMPVPTLGTFDARVLIRDGKYAGTWNHNEIGGHLFGTIEKLTEEELAELKEDQE